MTDELLTVKDVMARCSIGRTRAYELLKGDLRPVRLGPNGRLRVRASDLEAYIRRLEPAYEEAPRPARRT